jgi:spore coat protein U-like protein
MRHVRVLIVLICLGLVALPGFARAQTCNNTIVGGLFNGAVAITVTSLAFGTYSPQAAGNQQSSVTITASCSGGLLGGTLPPFTVAMSAGNGSVTQRQMLSGTSALRYQIYTSASLSTIWGDGTGSTSTVSGGNTGTASQTLTGYGVVTASQYVTPGSYADLITITVTY